MKKRIKDIFEKIEDTNSCIVERRFLFFKWREVVHDYKMISIHKFMSTSENFIVEYECSRCSTPKTHHFVKHDKLILEGISTKVLNRIGERSYYLKNTQ